MIIDEIEEWWGRYQPDITDATQVSVNTTK
jgi:hypothetical protein